jgi:isopenicillin N synthase-like dioxygenase
MSTLQSMIPVIDVADLAGPDAAARRRVAAALGGACRQVGFFYVSGHGIEQTTLAAVFSQARLFFEQPRARKLALSIRHSPHNRGYVDLSQEQLDPAAHEDHKEAFNIGLELPSRGRNVWPELPAWRQVMLDYFERCWSLGRLLHRGFSLDLGLPEDFFEDKLDAPLATLRLLHYPARDRAQRPRLGAGEHTDYGNVTLLATDGVAGLQVRTRTGAWIDAPCIAGTFVCNIGDCLMRWTNDSYVSTPHRVIAPERERYSVAFFLDPNPDAVVEAVCSGGPSKYPPITGAAYIQQRLDATYARHEP